jgi:hypothetical protein
MDGWNGRYLAKCQFCFHKKVFEKRRKVSVGVIGGYCHGTMVVQSTWRVLPMNLSRSCLIDPGSLS